MTTIGVFASVLDDKGQVLCVRQAYGERVWGMPGGRLEAGEDPVSALKREALEEASVALEVTDLVGAYSATYRDDLVLLFKAKVRERLPWSPTAEIAEIGFFPLSALPKPMSANTQLRFRDVAAGEAGVVRALSAPGVIHEAHSLSPKLLARMVERPLSTHCGHSANFRFRLKADTRASKHKRVEGTT